MVLLLTPKYIIVYAAKLECPLGNDKRISLIIRSVEFVFVQLKSTIYRILFNGFEQFVFPGIIG